MIYDNTIKELADQCWEGTPQVPDFDYQKFGELLVQECIDKITQEQSIAEQNWQCKNGVHICHELAKHFGVKE